MYADGSLISYASSFTDEAFGAAGNFGFVMALPSS